MNSVRQIDFEWIVADFRKPLGRKLAVLWTTRYILDGVYISASISVDALKIDRLKKDIDKQCVEKFSVGR